MRNLDTHTEFRLDQITWITSAMLVFLTICVSCLFIWNVINSIENIVVYLWFGVLIFTFVLSIVCLCKKMYRIALISAIAYLVILPMLLFGGYVISRKVEDPSWSLKEKLSSGNNHIPSLADCAEFRYSYIDEDSAMYEVGVIDEDRAEIWRQLECGGWEYIDDVSWHATMFAKGDKTIEYIRIDKKQDTLYILWDGVAAYKSFAAMEESNERKRLECSKRIDKN
ncbi:MAG: hypothetical protein MJZ79_05305 [Paludibacteraceae bacterium]|nr:hypothetical protein [Paludibacteraceae bacterium]